MTANVRVRFAPSPTGFFHIGSARTALFNWLYARHCHGVFVLRIEDTDRERNTADALQSCFDGMRWLGLDWDEGPEVGGDFGPYFQSQRQEIYEAHLQKLLDADRAYEREGAVYFRLEGERKMVFDKFKNAEVEKVLAEPVVIADAIRGIVRHPVETDFVIRRSNGDFGFHFTNVVDDLTMAITHVIRGEDHLTNTARHIRLYEAFGAQPPTFAHLPLILKGDGKGKMSKREPGAGLREHIDRRLLPEAFRNFLCLLGWNPKDNAEKLPIQDIIERFDFSGINKDGARFDEKKLAHLNTQYLRELPIETFAWHASQVLSEAGLMNASVDEDYLQRVLRLCQEKARDLPGLPDLCGFFFSDTYPLDAAALAKVSKKGDPKAKVASLLPVFAELEPEAWHVTTLDTAIEAHANQQNSKKFDYFPALRLAISGQGGGPDLLGCLVILGKTKVCERMTRFSAE